MNNILLFISVLILAIACSSLRNGQENERPNIIFIFSDDHANRAISAYGAGINKTPNIDRIASEGAIFLNSFCTNSICGPSRAAILTGLHSHLNGVVGNASPWNGEQTLLPRLLKDAGYNTALIGKWHLNSLPGDEFNYWKVLTGAGKQGFYYNPSFASSTGSGEEETIMGYSTDIVTDEALRWLGNNAGNEEESNPFMLFVQYKAPHVPRMPAFRFLDKYKNDTIPEPATLFDDYATRAPYAAAANMKIDARPLPLLEDQENTNNIYYNRMTRQQLEEWHSYKDPETREYLEMREKWLPEDTVYKKYVYQRFIKDYLRCVDGLDENIGRILDWLEDHKEIGNNTIVVYSSDQSYFTGEHGWAEKRFMYEEGMKMPLLVKWPGHTRAGSKIEALVQNIDYAPTLLDAAGVEIPETMQGRSFLPVLEGETPADWRQSVYYHYYDHGLHNVPRHEGVRNSRYKLIHFYTDGVWEFYDLQQDPHEINNIYGEGEYAQLVGEMKQELKRLRTFYSVPESHFQPPYVKAGKDQKL